MKINLRVNLVNQGSKTKSVGASVGIVLTAISLTIRRGLQGPHKRGHGIFPKITFSSS
jgi:hypothetical protein